MVTKIYSHAALFDYLLRGYTVKVASGNPSTEWKLVRGVLVNDLGDSVSFGFPMVEKGFYAAEKKHPTNIEERLMEAAAEHKQQHGKYPSELYLRPDEWHEATRALTASYRAVSFFVEGCEIKLMRGDS